MRSAGLKNITAKHLALASQSLSIMISLVPYIRETLRRHLNPKQAVMLIEFDKLKRDYQEHQYEIHAKLVAIMADRLAVHCKTLQVRSQKKQFSLHTKRLEELTRTDG
jgi:vacuolar protein sorting-associated protein 54